MRMGSNGQHEVMRPLLSPLYINHAVSNCLRLFMQEVRSALLLADVSAGRSNAAKMAMIAMTTSSSIKVKAVLLY